MNSNIQKVQDSKLYRSENIGINKVSILEERKLLKRGMLNRKVIKELNDYVFSNGENPFQNIQEMFEKKWDEAENKMEKMIN
jgi:hypothetical protein